MNGFLSLLRWDFVQQYRQKFWLMGGFATLMYIIMLAFIPQEYINLWIPVVLASDTLSLGFLFIAGAMFLEKTQGSVYAFAVTPVATSTWIISKIISLTVFCTTLACIIVLFIAEDVNWLRVVLALSLNAVFYNLLGFILAAPFRNINNFAVTTLIVTAISGIPVLWHFGILDHPLLWVIPSYPAIILLSGSLSSMPTLQFYGAAIVLTLWNILAFYFSVKLFHRFVSQRKGA